MYLDTACGKQHLVMVRMWVWHTALPREDWRGTMQALPLCRKEKKQRRQRRRPPGGGSVSPSPLYSTDDSAAETQVRTSVCRPTRRPGSACVPRYIVLLCTPAHTPYAPVLPLQGMDCNLSAVCVENEPPTHCNVWCAPQSDGGMVPAMLMHQLSSMSLGSPASLFSNPGSGRRGRANTRDHTPTMGMGSSARAMMVRSPLGGGPSRGASPAPASPATMRHGPPPVSGAGRGGAASHRKTPLGEFEALHVPGGGARWRTRYRHCVAHLATPCCTSLTFAMYPTDLPARVGAPPDLQARGVDLTGTVHPHNRHALFRPRVPRTQPACHSPLCSAATPATSPLGATLSNTGSFTRLPLGPDGSPGFGRGRGTPTSLQ